MGKNSSGWTRWFWVVFGLTVAVSAPEGVGAQNQAVRTYDFEGSVGPEWSVPYALQIDEHNKALGPFSNEALRAVKGVRLTVGEIPRGARVNLAFDLYLIGEWDSSDAGNRDQWILRIQDDAVLLTMADFPKPPRDGENAKEKAPTVTVAGRELPYLVVKQKVTVEPGQMEGKSLVLGFYGKVTGRNTEFWALDNVQVSFER